MQERFRVFARRISDYTGSSWAFIVAVVVIIGWMALGPWSRYSNTWQLVINTATTIITFLMVFLIQNTQNRDAKVMQLKLDELLRAIEQARTALVGLEDHSDADLAQVKAEFASLREDSPGNAPHPANLSHPSNNTPNPNGATSLPASAINPFTTQTPSTHHDVAL